MVEYAVWFAVWWPLAHWLGWVPGMAAWGGMCLGFWIGKARWYNFGLKDAVVIRDYARKEALEREDQRREAAPYN